MRQSIEGLLIEEGRLINNKAFSNWTCREDPCRSCITDAN